MRPRGLDKTVRPQGRTVYRGVVFIWAAKPRVKTVPLTPRIFLKTGHLPGLVDCRYANYYLEVHSVPTAITGLDAHLGAKLAVDACNRNKTVMPCKKNVILVRQTKNGSFGGAMKYWGRNWFCIVHKFLQPYMGHNTTLPKLFLSCSKR